MTGVIDKNIRFTPVMDGLRQPSFFQWYFDPFTDHPVSLKFDLSTHSRSFRSSCDADSKLGRHIRQNTDRAAVLGTHFDV